MTVENGFSPGSDQQPTDERQKPVILGPDGLTFAQNFGEFIAIDAYEHLRRRGVDIYRFLELRHRLMHVSAMQGGQLDLDQISEMGEQIDQWQQEDLRQEEMARELWHSGNRDLADTVNGIEVMRGVRTRYELMKLRVRARTETGYRIALRDIQYVDGGSGNRSRQVSVTQTHFERLIGSELPFSPKREGHHGGFVLRAQYRKMPEEFTPGHYEQLKWWTNRNQSPDN